MAALWPRSHLYQVSARPGAPVRYDRDDLKAWLSTRPSAAKKQPESKTLVGARAARGIGSGLSFALPGAAIGSVVARNHVARWPGRRHYGGTHRGTRSMGARMAD